MSRDGSKRRSNGYNFVGSGIYKGATAEGLLTCTSTFPAVHRIVDGLRGGDFRPIPNNDAYARYLVYTRGQNRFCSGRSQKKRHVRLGSFHCSRVYRGPDVLGLPSETRACMIHGQECKNDRREAGSWKRRSTQQRVGF